MPRDFDPETLKVKNDILQFMKEKHPQVSPSAFMNALVHLVVRNLAVTVVLDVITYEEAERMIYAMPKTMKLDLNEQIDSMREIHGIKK